MAVVSHKGSPWVNSDGLSINFGTAEATVAFGGHKVHYGRHCTEFSLRLANLATVASTNEMIIGDTVTIPSGALIEEIEVIVTEETAGVNANLDLGLVDQDRSTELDFNGLLAAADAFNGGTDLGTVTRYVVGTTEAGALVGTVLANTGLVTASADTADFTAGVLLIRIFWSVPLTADL
jgi:hypothetical protein